MTKIYGFIRRDDADDFVLRKVNTRSAKKKGYFKHQKTDGNGGKERQGKKEKKRKRKENKGPEEERATERMKGKIECGTKQKQKS